MLVWIRCDCPEKRALTTLPRRLYNIPVDDASTSPCFTTGALRHVPGVAGAGSGYRRVRDAGAAGVRGARRASIT